MRVDMETKLGAIDNISNEKVDRKISIALMASFVVLTAQYFLLVSFNLMGTNVGSTIQLVSKVLVGLAYLFIFPTVLRKNMIKAIMVYLIAIFIFVFHYAIFPENRMYMENNFFYFFFMSMPALLYSLNISDAGILKKTMQKTSYIVFVLGLFIAILVFTGRASLGTYSMALSYYMLLPVIMFIDDLIDVYSTKMLSLTLISLFIILSLGSRGPILCIIVFFVLKYIKTGTKRTLKREAGRLSLLSLAIIVFIFFEQIMLFVYESLLKVGINSRTIFLFLRGGSQLGSREQIFESTLDVIARSPIIGFGLFGDRRLSGSSYVHNIFIEVVGNFGVILGIILLAILILMILRSLITKDRLRYNITTIWLSLGFVHLMVSGSYLVDLKFWIFIGLLINQTFLSKRTNS
jgi:O-antigen ligase